MSSPARSPCLSPASAPLPAVSVLIPTKDRPADLLRAVASVLRQSLPAAEIVILDQSADGASERRIRRLHAAWSGARMGAWPGASHGSGAAPPPLRYCRAPSLRGLAAARNRAMEMAAGDIWLFLDDDVVLEPDYLAALLRAYAAHPEAAGISGVITNYCRPGIAYRAWRAVFARGPFRDPRQVVYWNAARLRLAPPRRVRCLGGGLMSFRAAALAGRRFDERLAGVCDGEDVDFCARLGPRAVLLMAPAARLAHHRSPVGREPIHWLRRQARSEAYLYFRNWRGGDWRAWPRRLCFAWLQTGYAVAALAGCARHRSARAWRAWRAGLADAHRIAAPGDPPPAAEYVRSE